MQVNQGLVVGVFDLLSAIGQLVRAPLLIQLVRREAVDAQRQLDLVPWSRVSDSAASLIRRIRSPGFMTSRLLAGSDQTWRSTPPTRPPAEHVVLVRVVAERAGDVAFR